MLCLKLQELCLGLLELGAAFQQCVMRLLVCLLELLELGAAGM